MTQETTTRRPLIRLIFGGVIALLIVFGLIYWGLWNSYSVSTKVPGELDGFAIINNGYEENLDLLFDANAGGVNGRPFTDGNFLITVNTQTEETRFERVPSSVRAYETQRDGQTSFYAQGPIVAIAQQYNWQWLNSGVERFAGGDFVIRDSNNKEINRVPHSELGLDLHDFEILPNGNYLYLGLSGRSIAPWAQDDTITCFTGCLAFSQVAVEQTPDGEIVHQYNLLDYYTREDVVLDDVVYYGDTPLYDITHANSVRLTPDGTAFIASVRHTDEILVIDRETGDIVWRSRDYTFVDDDLNGFRHQHDVQVLEDGTILIFDNGNGGEGISRGVRYEVDHDEKTLSLVWEYRHPEHYQPNRGSVRLLPDGNYLFSWVQERESTVEIVTPDGERLFGVAIPEPYAVYRASWRVAE